MKLDICFLFFVGCLIQSSIGEDRSNNRAKATNTPSAVKSEEQNQSVETTSSEKNEPVKNSKSKKPKEKEEIIVHNHGDRDYYESKASHYKPVDDFDFDKEYNDDTFDKFLKYFKANLETPEEDGFKTSTSVHTEHFEIKELNPKASTPEERYIIRGGYKVQESDPFDSKKAKKTHLHTYDSPLSKIAASIYSKFDYLNFPHNTNDDDEEGEPKENEQGEEGEATEKQEEKEEDNSDDDDNDDFYGKGYGNYKEDDEYNTEEEEEERDEEEDEEEDEKKEDEKKELGDYNTQPSTKQNKKSDDKEESRTLEYFSEPSFPTDVDSIYSDDWKKYILELVYGDFDDYYSPSSIYELKVRAKRKV